MSRALKVFISSTYLDNIERRKRVSLVIQRAEMLPVARVQRLRAGAVLQVPTQVRFAIGSPFSIGPRQIRNPQAKAYATEHVIELALLLGVEAPGEQLMRLLGVIDEHVKHIAMSPIRDGVTALALDRLVRRPDPIESARRGQLVGEHDPLSVRRGREEPADGITWQLPGEEQPIHRPVEREFGGRAREDEEHHVSITPDPPHDRTLAHEIGHESLRG